MEIYVLGYIPALGNAKKMSYNLFYQESNMKRTAIDLIDMRYPLKCIKMRTIYTHRLYKGIKKIPGRFTKYEKGPVEVLNDVGY